MPDTPSTGPGTAIRPFVAVAGGFPATPPTRFSRERVLGSASTPWPGAHRDACEQSSGRQPGGPRPAGARGPDRWSWTSAPDRFYPRSRSRRGPRGGLAGHGAHRPRSASARSSSPLPGARQGGSRRGGPRRGHVGRTAAGRESVDLVRGKRAAERLEFARVLRPDGIRRGCARRGTWNPSSDAGMLTPEPTRPIGSNQGRPVLRSANHVVDEIVRVSARWPPTSRSWGPAASTDRGDSKSSARPTARCARTWRCACSAWPAHARRPGKARPMAGPPPRRVSAAARRRAVGLLGHHVPREPGGCSAPPVRIGSPWRHPRPTR